MNMLRFAAGVLLTLGLGPLAFSSRAQEPTPAGAQPSFDEFVAGLRTEALSRGISQATVDAALTGLVAPQPVVVSRDRTQPEQTLSLDQYLKQYVIASRVRTGRQMLTRHRALLRKVEASYGVPPAVMVAIWGFESNFGKFTGSYPTIQALATLAYDNRRPLFRTELFHALQIVDQGVIAAGDLKGSWAGAMGQPQFMPSSYLKHAVDFDGDQRADIWSSQADVFGSMANYLKNAGWTAGERWGREVKVSRAVMDRIERAVEMRGGSCRAIRELTVAQPLAAWKKLGVVLASGAPLPNASFDASLVRGQNRHFLVYRNFDALLDYNCSNSYALAIALLSDRIASR
jgi:membrane-bound lytic murein transglycosylase B